MPDFDGEQCVDTFLDWKHRVKSFFKMFEVSEVWNLQFVQSKLTGIALIWWSTYKKSVSKSGNGNMITRGEMKMVMKKRFAPKNYK